MKFRRNYGQTPAMAAGIQHARGTCSSRWTATCKTTRPTSPCSSRRSTKAIDIVVGWRFNRQDKLITRKIPSRIANWLIGKITGVPIKDNGCSLKAYRGSLIKEIPLYSEMHRFIPAMASIAGPRIAEIKVRHHARQFGQSKYGLSRIYKVLLDLLVIKTVASFTARPLLWFSMLATPSLVARHHVAIGYSLWHWATTGTPIPLPVAGTGVLLWMSAFILVCGGILGELIYRFGDVRDRDFSRLTGTTWRSGTGTLVKAFAHE